MEIVYVHVSLSTYELIAVPAVQLFSCILLNVRNSQKFGLRIWEVTLTVNDRLDHALVSLNEQNSISRIVEREISFLLNFLSFLSNSSILQRYLRSWSRESETGKALTKFETNILCTHPGTHISMETFIFSTMHCRQVTIARQKLRYLKAEERQQTE